MLIAVCSQGCCKGAATSKRSTRWSLPQLFALARLTPFPSGSHVELSIRSHCSEIGCLRVWVNGEPCWAIGLIWCRSWKPRDKTLDFRPTWAAERRRRART
jgi:hypothetical protein